MKYLLIIIGLIITIVSVTAQPQSENPKRTIKKNAVYYEFFGIGLFVGSINYDRYLPISEKSGIILRGGISWYDEVFPLGEINFLSGNQKHHFETGIGYTAFQEGHLAFIRTGYRFHGRKGFVFRAAPIYCLNESFLWFGISVGYSF